ncbi:hypothetical protein E2C01_068220 [Portunus trituberculatus]|uniref:Uncharacterized protein n=1 Tax=Portunus trituberculatus TaxID=210409 RepID=A0A5B7HYU6_PORTR|nr:hypothetical protein [Portunus trituberculatus]
MSQGFTSPEALQDTATRPDLCPAPPRPSLDLGKRHSPHSPQTSRNLSHKPPLRPVSPPEGRIEEEECYGRPFPLF